MARPERIGSAGPSLPRPCGFTDFSHTQTHTQTDTHSDRQRHRQTQTQTDTHTDTHRHTHTHTETHTHTHTHTPHAEALNLQWTPTSQNLDPEPYTLNPKRFDHLNLQAASPTSLCPFKPKAQTLNPEPIALNPKP